MSPKTAVAPRPVRVPKPGEPGSIHQRITVCHPDGKIRVECRCPNLRGVWRFDYDATTPEWDKHVEEVHRGQ